MIGGGWAVILGHFQGGIDFFVQPKVAIYQPAWVEPGCGRTSNSMAGKIIHTQC